ncbi:MAG TPA: LuxR C-terminal-related transcriptional regulator [Chthoniobacterales bacterium]
MKEMPEIVTHDNIGMAITSRSDSLLRCVQGDLVGGRAVSVAGLCLVWQGGAALLKSGSLVSIVRSEESARDRVRVVLVSAGYRVRTFSSVREFLAQMQYPGPSCVVLDFDLPDASALAIPQILQESDRSDQVVFISIRVCMRSCVNAMRAGAVDYLTVPVADHTLLESVEFALQRSASIRNEYADRASARFRLSSLTRRELSVLKLLLEGMPNKDIGARLGIAESTIKIHRRRVMEKARAKSLVDIVLLAQRGGIPFPHEDFASA